MITLITWWLFLLTPSMPRERARTIASVIAEATSNEEDAATLTALEVLEGSVDNPFGTIRVAPWRWLHIRYEVSAVGLAKWTLGMLQDAWWLCGEDHRGRTGFVYFYMYGLCESRNSREYDRAWRIAHAVCGFRICAQGEGQTFVERPITKTLAPSPVGG